MCVFFYLISRPLPNTVMILYSEKTRTTIYRLHGAGWDDVLNYPRGFAASNTVIFEKKMKMPRKQSWDFQDWKKIGCNSGSIRGTASIENFSQRLRDR